MRLFPILTALMVTLAVYLFTFERPALLAFAGVTETEAAAEERITGADAEGVISVVAMHSVAQPVESGVLLRGRTEAARQVDVRAETSGLVVSEPLRKGALVEAGQVLCRLDPGTREAQLAEARARLIEAQVNAEAAEKLAEKGFASETRAISAIAALQSAQAAVQLAEKEIERLSIKAPFAGLLESDTAELGSLLQPGAACARIIQLDPIKLVGFAPETETAKIRLGAPAGGRLATGQEVFGKVTFVSRSADPTTRTFRIEVEVANPDMHIADGSTAEIFVAFAGEKAHLIPQSALTLNDEGALGVRTVEGDIARFVPVSILRDTTDGVWLRGLPDEADVIVVGQEFVIDGRKVAPTFREN